MKNASCDSLTYLALIKIMLRIDTRSCSFDTTVIGDWYSLLSPRP